jgi:DNA/RNA endonuclease YhcR with UshA esterase domain
MVVQDSTGSISVLLDISNFYTDFPIGRRVFINCLGLYMNSYNDLIQLGASIDNTLSYPTLGRIPSSLISKYVVKGTYYHSVTPKVYTMDSLLVAAYMHPLNILNTLVTITDVQFSKGDLSRTWADPVGLNDRNIVLEECNHFSIDVRSSGYSDFAGQTIPSSHGSITGVIQIYSGSLQLKIRDLTDINMALPRCGEITNTCIYNDVPDYMSISDLRFYAGQGNFSCPSNTVLKGIVISDDASDNFDPKNMVIQDSTGGIVVRYTSEHQIPLGYLVEINVSGQDLVDYNGLIEVSNVSIANCDTVGTCVEVPVEATIQQISMNLDAYESRLVKIYNVSFIGGGPTYSDATVISDPTGSMTVFTKSGATFGYESYPTGPVTYITGVVTDYFGPEFLLRNLTDIHP